MFESIIRLWRRAFQGLTARQLIRQLGDAIRRDGPFDLAAQLAYWSLLALFPFAIMVLTLTAYLPLHGLDLQLMAVVHQLMPGDAAGLFEATVHDVIGKQRGWLLVLAMAGALWTAAGGVSATTTALNKAWEVEESRPFWKTRLIALGVTMAATVLLVIALGALLLGPEIGHRVFAWLGLGSVFDHGWKLARWPVVWSSMMFILALLYWSLPDIKNRFRFITPGAVVATLLWIAVSVGFGQYASRMGRYSAVYGTLGAAVVLMTWLYLSGLVVILGGVVNAILDRAAQSAALTGAEIPITGGNAMEMADGPKLAAAHVPSELRDDLPDPLVDGRAAPIPSDPSAMSTLDLVRESIANLTLLAKRQIDLLRLEALQELRKEVNSGIDLAAGGAVALVGVILLLVSAVIGVAQVSRLPVWATALMSAGLMLISGAILGIVGWRRRVRRWVPISRGEIKEELTWARNQKI